MRIGDLEVGRLGFGAMRLCGPGIWGAPADPENALRVLRRVVELGIALIDTSDAYGPEVNELQIAEALSSVPRGARDRDEGRLHCGPGPGGGTPTAAPSTCARPARGACGGCGSSGSTSTSCTPPILHVPLAESVGTLKELRDEGKIRHVGLSNVSVAELEEAERIVPIVSVQNRYNVAEREGEDVLEACEARGIPFLPWARSAQGASTPPRRCASCSRARR